MLLSSTQPFPPQSVARGGPNQTKKHAKVCGAQSLGWGQGVWCTESVGWGLRP